MNLILNNGTSNKGRNNKVTKHWQKISEGYNHIGAMTLVTAWNLEEKLKTLLYSRLFVGAALAVVAISLINPAEAITVDSLKAPMQDLKKEMFDGWMWGAKAIAGVVGAGFAMAKQSLAPFGIGIGTAAGIHFWDKYIGDGSGALI